MSIDKFETSEFILRKYFQQYTEM